METGIPRALFDLKLPSKKSLLHLQVCLCFLACIAPSTLQAERLLAVEQAAGGRPLPWYILTSAATHQAVQQALEEHAYYGLSRGQV